MGTQEILRKPKLLQLQAEVPAGIKEVWDAWTTEEGVKSFFAPACRIDLRPDGFYEILFAPEAPAGSRGAEGTRVMALRAPSFFSFSWNFPPSLPEIREQRTLVTLRFEAVNERSTAIDLTQTGWLENADWNKGYEYFHHAWSKIVFPRLRYRFESGPIDWKNPPSF